MLGATQRKEGYMEGNGYQVTWTFGHLLMLKSPDEYNPEWKRWSLDYLPMLPKEFTTKLIDDPGIRKQFKIICNLYHGADMIINCGDAGQEGELIQRWVMEKAGVRCPVKRLWISSLTEDAIRDGFNHLQPQGKFDSLYEAGQARAIGDWLLGMNGTRLFTKKYGGYHQVLSIGRVQTPTLAMIVNRYQQIVNFKPEPYWVLTTLYKGVTFTASQGKYSNQVDGQKVLDMIVGQPFCIKDVQRKQGKEQQPQLYDLTTLQVDCNKKYGFSADETLKIIQSLYEKKLTTYPRVDTRFLSDDIYAECPRILRGLKEYADYTKTLDMKSLSKSSRVFDSSKVTDHHAIIPTGEVHQESLQGNRRFMILSVDTLLQSSIQSASMQQPLLMQIVIPYHSRQQERKSSTQDGDFSFRTSIPMMIPKKRQSQHCHSSRKENKVIISHS